jgi:hypothetical protein
MHILFGFLRILLNAKFLLNIFLIVNCVILIGVNQWVGPPPKDINISSTGPKPTGWEEPSPPAQRRNIPNYDDGTSLWGNPAQQQNRMGGRNYFIL